MVWFTFIWPKNNNTIKLIKTNHLNGLILFQFQSIVYFSLSFILTYQKIYIFLIKLNFMYCYHLSWLTIKINYYIDRDDNLIQYEMPAPWDWLSTDNDCDNIVIIILIWLTQKQNTKSNKLNLINFNNDNQQSTINTIINGFVIIDLEPS